MKLTDPENIQENEKDFIDTINAELDWEIIEKLLLEKHNFTLQDEIIYKNGDLIVHKDKIAYKFDFDIKVPLSIIFDRQGECLDILTLREDEKDPDLDSVSTSDRNDVNKTASDIADMISEINEGDD